jgi:hypothetical protein
MFFREKTLETGGQDGHCSPNHSHSVVSWCCTAMAVQQELGLLAQRRYRNNSLDSSHPFATRKDMTGQ